MKKGLVVCLCVMGVVLFFGLLTGCSMPGGSTNPIVGTWSLGTLAYTFTSNGTFTISVSSVATFKGNYTKNDSAATLHLTILSAPFQDFTYAFGPGNSTISLTGTGSTAGTNLILIRQ